MCKVSNLQQKKCKKISFVEAGILDRPRKIKRDYTPKTLADSGISIQEAGEQLQKAMQKYNKLYYRNYKQEGGSYDNSKSR